MSSELQIALISGLEKELLRNLMQAYRHDMSEFDGSDPDESGSFGVGSYFEAYWTESTRHPFKILFEQLTVGFALVRQLEPNVYSMAEFFILRKHRKAGIGRDASFLLFNQFAGTWHVAQDESNLPSQSFWRKVIDEYTSGNYEERWSDAQPRGPMQVFRSQGV